MYYRQSRLFNKEIKPMSDEEMLKEYQSVLEAVYKALEQMEEYKKNNDEENLPLYTTNQWDKEKKEVKKIRIGSKAAFETSYKINKEAKEDLEKKVKELEEKLGKKRITVGKKWTREDLKRWGMGD